MTTIRKCNWCKDEFEQADGEKKRYCDDCGAKCKKECRACHKPYPNLKYYNSINDKRCASCVKKYENQALSRKQKKFALENLEAYNASKRGGRRNPLEKEGEAAVSQCDSKPPKSCLSSSEEEEVPPVEEIEGDQLISDLIVNESEQGRKKKSKRKAETGELSEEEGCLISDISKSEVKEVSQPRKRSKKKQQNIFEHFESETKESGKEKKHYSPREREQRDKVEKNLLDCILMYNKFHPKSTQIQMKL